MTRPASAGTCGGSRSRTRRRISRGGWPADAVARTGGRPRGGPAAGARGAIPARGPGRVGAALRGRLEPLLVAEDDAPMRLVALALGDPGDRALAVALDRLLAGQTRRAVAALRRVAADLDLVGRVEAHL